MSTDSVSRKGVVSDRSAEGGGSAGPAPRAEEGEARAVDGEDMPPGAGPGQEPKGGELAKAVSELNDHVQNIQRDLQFGIDEVTGRTVIEIIDSDSKEVIRQIPPEEVLALARTLERRSDGTIPPVKA